MQPEMVPELGDGTSGNRYKMVKLRTGVANPDPDTATKIRSDPDLGSRFSKYG